jgi:hypothetical protein
MKTESTVVALAVAAMLLGCSAPAEMARQQTTAVCGLSNTKEQACRVFKVGDKQRAICHAYVFTVGRDEPPVVYPHTLVVPRQTETVIVWHLAQPRMEFLQEDGPQWSEKDSEFEPGQPTDDSDGGDAAPSANKGRNYRVKYKNSVPNKSSKYVIQFRDSKLGTVYRCDPVINNEGN